LCDPKRPDQPVVTDRELAAGDPAGVGTAVVPNPPVPEFGAPTGDDVVALSAQHRPAIRRRG
jgi:hypothetical protein